MRQRRTSEPAAPLGADEGAGTGGGGDTGDGGNTDVGGSSSASGSGTPVPGRTAAAGPSPLLHGPAAARLRAAAAADAAAPRRDFLFAPPSALHKPLAALLADPRDLPILFLFLNIALTTAPAAAALFALFPPASRPLPHLLGAAYLLVNSAAYLARFMLSLHFSQHRQLFRRGGWAPGGAYGESGSAAQGRAGVETQHS